MSLTWIRDSIYGAAGSRRVNERDDGAVVAESLLMELDCQIRESEERHRERERDEKRQKMSVDYSWLVSTTPKSYEMPQVERLELEELCFGVKPHESGGVITHFRELLAHDPPAHEIARLLRAVVMTTLQARPREETVGEWVTKRTRSLSNIRPHSSRVVPLESSTNGGGEGGGEGGERRRSMPARHATSRMAALEETHRGLPPGHYVPGEAEGVGDEQVAPPQQLSVGNLPGMRLMTIEDLPV